jgi:hypothetical protein
MTVTTRVYLASATVRDEVMQPRDLPAERFFVNATDVHEVWVETESDKVPDVGRAASFALVHPMDIGFRRIVGTVERKFDKARRR